MFGFLTGNVQPAQKSSDCDSDHARRWPIPLLYQIRNYRRSDLIGDLIAGFIVAVMLVPQGMAYAQLAGLPAQVGLYASMVPLIVYGLLGSSRSLAVGPVAIVSLLVATGAAAAPVESRITHLEIALLLALMVGAIQLVMGLLRVGFVVNFLSHPVLAGFTSAAAIIIGFSQLKHLLGFSVPRQEFFYQQLQYTFANLDQMNWSTVMVGGVAIIWLIGFKRFGRWLLEKVGVPAVLITPLVKSAPLFMIAIATASTAYWRLDTAAGVKIVGGVPAGLPGFNFPVWDGPLVISLLPLALTISLVAYMESVSVAKSLARRRREHIEPDQELVALGLANFGAALTGGYPVTGGISRSVVNFESGARSGVASIVTAGLVAISLLLLTPLFFYIPQAALAAIIMVAVGGLIDWRSFIETWRYSVGDGLAQLITFSAVLAVGVEKGILYGVLGSLIIFVWRTSRPHVAIVGRLGESELYRNVERHPVQQWPQVVAMRVDQSLYFANTRFLEQKVEALLRQNPNVEHFVLIGTAINFIDASALETLESILAELEARNVKLHLAAIKGPVLDRLEAADFVKHIGRDRIHLSTHAAMQALGLV